MQQIAAGYDCKVDSGSRAGSVDCGRCVAIGLRTLRLTLLRVLGLLAAAGVGLLLALMQT